MGNLFRASRGRRSRFSYGWGSTLDFFLVFLVLSKNVKHERPPFYLDFARHVSFVDK